MVLTRDCASWLCCWHCLKEILHGTIKPNVLAEGISSWLSTCSAIAQAAVHLLALNVQATCITGPFVDSVSKRDMTTSLTHYVFVRLKQDNTEE